MGKSDNYFHVFKSKKENTEKMPINEVIKVFPMEKYEEIIDTERGKKLISKLKIFQNIIEDEHRASRRENYPSSLKSKLLDFYKQDIVPQEEIDIEMSFDDWKEAKKDPDMVLLGWQPEVAKFKKELEKDGIVIPIDLLERINNRFRDLRYSQGEREGLKKDTTLEDRIEGLTRYQTNIFNSEISDAELINLRESLGGWISNSIKRIVENKLSRGENSWKQKSAVNGSIDRDKENKAVEILLEEAKQDLKEGKAVLEDLKKFIEKVKADKAKMSEEEKFNIAKEKLQTTNWKQAFVHPYEKRLSRWKNKSDFFNEMEKWIKFFKQSEKFKKELEKNNEDISKKREKKKSEPEYIPEEPYWWKDEK